MNSFVFVRFYAEAGDFDALRRTKPATDIAIAIAIVFPKFDDTLSKPCSSSAAMYKSKRIRLRPIEENDAPKIMEMRADMKDIQSYVGRPFPNNEEGEREWIRNLYHKGPLSTIALVVEEIDSREFVGFVVAGNISYTNRNATIGVFFHKNARGKGYYREAQVLFYTYLFREINLHKLTSSVVPYNEIAIKITAELGYTRDGVRKEQIFQNGKYYDEIMISLMGRDFFEKNDVEKIVD